MRLDGLRRNSIDVVEALAGQRAGRLVIVDVREARERARGFVSGLSTCRSGSSSTAWESSRSDSPVAFICQKRPPLGAGRETAARRAGVRRPQRRGRHERVGAQGAASWTGRPL